MHNQTPNNLHYPSGLAAGNVTKYDVTPYTGIGSGVLESGTLLDLTDKDAYTGSADIVGHIEAPGTWALRKIQSDGTDDL